MNAIFEQRKYDSDFHVWTHSYRNLYSLPHYHPEIQIIRIREGCTNITIHKDTYFCHAGDILFCRGSEPHSVCSIPGQNCIVDFIAISPTVFRYITRANYQVKRHIPLEELEKEGMEEFSNQVFFIVQKELKEKPFGYQEAIQSILELFLVYYTRYFLIDPPQKVEPPKYANLIRVQKVMNYIEQNYSQEITLKKAAELMGYEPCHCSKMFKKLNGMNFISYLNNVRIKKAIEKIHWTDHSITQIAFECGFHNVRNFNRVFKTVTGQSPTGFLNTIFQQTDCAQSETSSQNSPAFIYFEEEWD